MDFTRALTFPFEDDEWLSKLGLGLLISLIPIIGNPLAVRGWSFRLAQAVKRGDPTPMPDWSDFGGKLGKGLMVWLAGFIYQIPTIVVFCLLWGVFFLPAMSGGNDDLATALAGGASIIAVCCLCVVFLYAIAAGLVYLAGYLRYMDNEDEFGTFFQFGDNIALLRENIGDFGMFILYLFLAGLIASLVSGVTFGLGGLLAAPFMMYFGGHLTGQLATKVSAASAPAV
jgi:hypothetical protein